MAETPKSLSVSFRQDVGSIEHNNRFFVADNVDGSRSADNIIYVQKDLREFYHELFDGALEQLGTLLTVINRDNLCTIGELEGKIEQIKFELENSRQEVNTMETKCNHLKSLATLAEEYFSLMDKPSLTAEEQLRVEMYKETLAQKNIKSRSDYDYLKGVIAEAEEKTAPIKAHYNKCAELLREYSNIAETYNLISQGDYISKLIERKRKKDEPQASSKISNIIIGIPL